MPQSKSLRSTAILAAASLAVLAWGASCGNGGSGSTKDGGGSDVGVAGSDATGSGVAGGGAAGGGAAGGDAAGATGGSGGATGNGGASGNAGTSGSGGTGGASGNAGAGGRGGTGSTAGASGNAGVTGAAGATGALAFNPPELIYAASLSITTTGVPRTVALHNGTGGAVSIASLAIGGTDASTFVLEGAPTLPTILAPAGDLNLTVRFRPAVGATATTVYSATLTASPAAGALTTQAGLFGLAMNAANSEPALDQVVRTLGYAINVGGTSTNLGTGSALIGDEIAAPRFVKVRAGMVSVTPVARYSPFETAPYGTYAGSNPNVTRSPLGAMSRGAADNVANRTLFPPLDPGAMATFDPGAASFGIYAESASNVASLGADGRFYQEDALNNDQAGVLPVHRVRVYPMKNRTGQPVADTYLVVCEEASNSDYQDYVFVVSNVAPSTN